MKRPLFSVQASRDNLCTTNAPWFLRWNARYRFMSASWCPIGKNVGSGATESSSRIHHVSFSHLIGYFSSFIFGSSQCFVRGKATLRSELVISDLCVICAQFIAGMVSWWLDMPKPVLGCADTRLLVSITSVVVLSSSI